MENKKAKKSRNLRFGHILNYLVAAFAVVAATGWIENLGVVPLFFISAFLFAPAFFFFLNLLFSVTHVLETIGKLLYNCLDQLRTNTNKYKLFLKPNYKPYFLPIKPPSVKGFFAVCFILANSGNFNLMAAEDSDIILSKGQSTTIVIPDLNKFNVGNKEVLSYKFNEKTKELLIRGATIGSSELIIWKKSQKKPIKRQIFVISKAQELKSLNIAQILTDIGLEVRPGLPHIQVTGEIKTLSQLVEYKRLQKANKEIIIDQTTLGLEAKKALFADVYKLLLNEYKDSVKCEIIHSQVNCLYHENEAPSKSLISHLVEKYQISFVQINNQKMKNNYNFKLRMIQLEQLDGEELRLGLEGLNTTLGDLIRMPLRNIVEKNAVILNNKKINMNTLAEPHGLIRPKSPAEFSIGADVPYVISGKDGIAQTSWQFAGLKIKIELENLGDKLLINYETQLTRPDSSDQGSISGNKEKSSVVLALDTPIKLFQITLKTQGDSLERMPFISRIPVLGELFKSKGSQNNYKLITGVLEITHQEEK